MNIEELLKKDSNIANNFFQFFTTKEVNELRLVSNGMVDIIKTIEFNDLETKLKENLVIGLHP